MALTPNGIELADRVTAAVNHGLRYAEADPDSVLPETVNAVLATVLPEVDRLTAALEVATTQHAKAIAARDKARSSAKTSDSIAKAERQVFGEAIRDLGGDPVQVQNLYAQLRSRTRQWEDAKAEADRLRVSLLAVSAFADRDQDGATCPHNVTGQLRHILNALPAGSTANGEV